MSRTRSGTERCDVIVAARALDLCKFKKVEMNRSYQGKKHAHAYITAPKEQLVTSAISILPADRLPQDAPTSGTSKSMLG